MPVPYKKVLVLGATSGVGEALAARLVQDGAEVIVVGRRQEKLDSFVQEHGKDKASAQTFDVSQLDKIPEFVAGVFKEHPDCDAVMLNSGIQRHLDFSKPDSVDLKVLSEELNTNYTSYLYLTHALLPYLQKQNNQTALIYTSSGLALVPLTRYPTYCATKAALHSFLMVLREQLKNGPGNVKVVEIFPPAVQTELHDKKHQPDMKNGGSFGMPLADFTKEAYDGLAAGKDQIAVGMASGWFNGFEQDRQKAFHGVIKQMQGSK